MAVFLFKNFRTAVRNLRIKLLFGRKSTDELRTELENLERRIPGDKARHTARMQRKLLNQQNLLIKVLQGRGVKL